MQPGGFNPKGEDWIARKFADLERQLLELKAANPFSPMGIRPKKDGTEFDGFVNVKGAMDVSGDAEFIGNVKIGGTLELPNGVIGNDALTDPLVVETSGVSQNNFALGTATTTLALGTVAIPAGYTRASVLCLVIAGGQNSTAELDYIYAASSINGVGGGETPQPATAGGYASASANGIRTLTGLNGGTITLGCRVRTQTASWAAGTANFANMNAVVYFSR